jgi:hypothetical protein
MIASRLNFRLDVRIQCSVRVWFPCDVTSNCAQESSCKLSRVLAFLTACFYSRVSSVAILVVDTCSDIRAHTFSNWLWQLCERFVQTSTIVFRTNWHKIYCQLHWTKKGSNSVESSCGFCKRSAFRLSLSNQEWVSKFSQAPEHLAGACQCQSEGEGVRTPVGCQQYWREHSMRQLVPSPCAQSCLSPQQVASAWPAADSGASAPPCSCPFPAAEMPPPSLLKTTKQRVQKRTCSLLSVPFRSFPASFLRV